MHEAGKPLLKLVPPLIFLSQEVGFVQLLNAVGDCQSMHHPNVSIMEKVLAKRLFQQAETFCEPNLSLLH